MFRRMGFAPADADDLAQETFVRAFKGLATFDASRGSLRPWLGAIARNTARRAWQRRNDPQSFDPELADAMFPSEAVDPGDESAAREEHEAVGACVKELPADLGRLVRLRYVEGRATRSIAEITRTPESTVRLRLDEAARLIETCLRRKGVVGDGR